MADTNSQLAAVQSGTLNLPPSYSEFLDKNHNLMSAKAYIQTAAGEKVNAKEKITDLVKRLGDKGKALRKAYNAARPVIAKAHALVWAAAGADPTMRKQTKFVINSKGQFIGIDGKARFVKRDTDVDSLVEKIAELEAKLAAATALPAKA